MMTEIAWITFVSAMFQITKSFNEQGYCGTKELVETLKSIIDKYDTSEPGEHQVVLDAIEGKDDEA